MEVGKAAEDPADSVLVVATPGTEHQPSRIVLMKIVACACSWTPVAAVSLFHSKAAVEPSH